MDKYQFAKSINGTDEAGILKMANPPELICLCTKENSELILSALNRPDIKHDRVEPNEELMSLAKDKVSVMFKLFSDFWNPNDGDDTELFEIIDALAIEYSNLLNQQDSVKFADWIAEQSLRSFGKNKWISYLHSTAKTTTELYQEYIKTLNK